MSSSSGNDADVLLVPCEWSDGTVTQRCVPRDEAFVQIARRPSAKLTRVGAELGRATWLMELHLDRYRLDSLPNELSSLTGLRWLFLSNNAFRRVPACVPRLSALQELWLRDNPLEELPDEIGNLQALTDLDISDCPHLHWLPSSVARLTRLTHLRFSEKIVAWLPSTMRSMTQLQALDTTRRKYRASPSPSVAPIVKLNQLLDNCLARERTFLTELALGLAPMCLPVLLMTHIWERVHGARMPDAAGWFVSEQRRWLVFEAVHKAATRKQSH